MGPDACQSVRPQPPRHFQGSVMTSLPIVQTESPRAVEVPAYVPCDLASHRFPSAAGLARSLEVVPSVALSTAGNAPAFLLDVSPGVVTLRSTTVHAARAEVLGGHVAPSYERLSALEGWSGSAAVREAVRARAAALVASQAAYEDEGGPDWGEVFAEPGPQGRGVRAAITRWSPSSRANMVRRLASLDYAPMFAGPGRPVMVTLTYPADWLCVAPDGAAVKAHFRAFMKRLQRARGGAPVPYVAKLEFQHRGAPHVHAFMPDGGGVGFRAWVAENWAEIVNHPDALERMAHESAGTSVDWAEGLRMRDPRRLAVYFAKHSAPGQGSKEYQHIVPPEWACAWSVETRQPRRVGRFWWYGGGLRPVSAGCAISQADYVAARRILRSWARHHELAPVVVAPCGCGDCGGGFVRRAVAALRTVSVSRGNGRRKVRRRVARLAAGVNQWTGQIPGGFVVVNDGAAFAEQLGRALQRR